MLCNHRLHSQTIIREMFTKLNPHQKGTNCHLGIWTEDPAYGHPVIPPVEELPVLALVSRAHSSLSLVYN
jgi:hypothetical protein